MTPTGHLCHRPIVFFHLINLTLFQFPYGEILGAFKKCLYFKLLLV